MIGALYKRTRVGKDGIKRQRAEVRFDDTAGCLRTPLAARVVKSFSLLRETAFVVASCRREKRRG